MTDLVLDIERPVAGGRMLARHGGQVVFVAGALPGERVRARVERMTRQATWAQTVEVETASADRREPICDPACGGLAYAHVAYPRQLTLKSEIIADAFRRVGKIVLDGPVLVRGSSETGYRLRARLHIHDGRAGFFREGTHVWCDAAQTGQLLPATLPAIEAQLAALGARLSDVDAVIVAENIAARERVLHVEPREGARLDDLQHGVQLAAGVTGVTTAARPPAARRPAARPHSGRPRRPGAQGRRGGDRDSGRAPAAARPVTLAGSATVTDAARDLFAGDSPVSELAAWTRHAAAFFQGNRHCTGALVRRVLDFTTTERVVDLYAGVGLFAVALAARGASVVAIEGDRLAAADLSANAGPWRARLATICAPVEQAAAVLQARRPEGGESDGTAGTVIVDPPRTGLSPAALAQVLALGAKEVIYVSCDPATLARDAAHLVADGFRLDTIDAFDLFPNTPHIETVVRFLRA